MRFANRMNCERRQGGRQGSLSIPETKKRIGEGVLKEDIATIVLEVWTVVLTGQWWAGGQ